MPKSVTFDQLKLAILKECKEILNEMIFHVYDSISSRYKQSLDQDASQFWTFALTD